MIDLVDRYRQQVLGLCHRMLGQRQDAEDAAQETFVRMNGYFHNLLKFGGLRLKIKDISDGVRNVSIQGKIVDMNAFMILLDDGSGKIFVRYRSRDLADPLAIGDRIRVQKCRARIYSGILEIRLERSGRIIKLPESHVQYP